MTRGHPGLQVHVAEKRPRPFVRSPQISLPSQSGGIESRQHRPASNFFNSLLVYPGPDVSLETSSIRSVDAEGHIKLEAKAPSKPEPSVAHLSQLIGAFERVSLEATPLS